MQIEHRGTIDGRQPHKGLYIATGVGGFKLMFKPGVNRISPDDWAKVKESAGVRHRLESRALVIREDDSKGEGKKGERFTLKSLGLQEQFDLVERTIDPDVLQTWARQGGLDPKVAELLAEQIKAVTTDWKGQPAEPRKIELQPVRMPEGIVNKPDAPAA
jgi:hypothetical protein